MEGVEGVEEAHYILLFTEGMAMEGKGIRRTRTRLLRTSIRATPPIEINLTGDTRQVVRVLFGPAWISGR